MPKFGVAYVGEPQSTRREYYYTSALGGNEYVGAVDEHHVNELVGEISLLGACALEIIADGVVDVESLERGGQQTMVVGDGYVGDEILAQRPRISGLILVELGAVAVGVVAEESNV